MRARSARIGVVALLCVAGVVGCDRDRRHDATRSSTASTSAPVSSATIGSRVCSTIWASATPDFVVRPQDVAIGPLTLGAMLDGSEEAPPKWRLADGVVALATKNPLTIQATGAGTVRMSVTDPHDAVRVLYDDAGLAASAAGRYRFRDGVRAIDLGGPARCGEGAGGLVQYNGGFVVRAPTCATVSVALDGTTVGTHEIAFAGGRC